MHLSGVMSATCRLLAGLLAYVVLASAAVAEPARIWGPALSPTAPSARGDAQVEEWNGRRPSARPVWMIRYPVTIETQEPDLRPVARPSYLLPEARWDFRSDGRSWTRAAMSALAAHGRTLEAVVPQDIDRWCPGYRQADAVQRRAFWVGLMSALAKYESTWRPDAVGGGNRWFGLLQIYPPTARGYGCLAQTGADLKDPADNLSCAIRIMAVTVERDNAIAVHDGRWRGVAADWGPMTSRGKVAEMSSWTRSQSYCQPHSTVLTSLRPRSRPADVVMSTMDWR